MENRNCNRCFGYGLFVGGLIALIGFIIIDLIIK